MRFFVFVFLMCSSVLLYAQRFNVNLTSETQENNPILLKFGDVFFSLNIEMQGISGFSANLKRALHSIEVKKYSADLKVIKSIKISNGERLYGPIAPLLKIIANNLYLFYYKMPEEGRVQFFSSMIDPVSLELSEPTELLDIKQKTKFLEF
jgi:hypothetical protein